MSTDKTLTETINRIDKRIERIEMVLLGDEEAEQEGLVHKVKFHSKYIENDKKIKNKILGGVLVGTPILVMLWDKLLHLIGLK